MPEGVPMHGALRLINLMSISRNMVWPMAGGILDQDPLFIRRFTHFLNTREAYEEKKKDREARMKGGAPPPVPRNA